MYRTILFDLDGTLTDPGIGITNSVAHALRKFGIEPESREALYSFIGPPLRDSFMQEYGFTYAQSDDAIRYFREYFRQTGIYENTLYPGISAVLRSLKEAGRTLILATSKPEEFAVQILKHFALYSYFDQIAGAKMDETRTKKKDVISYALALGSVEKPSEAVMVGDREYDILGAAENGLASIGVLYGYGSEAELRRAGATHLAAAPEDLLEICL